MAAGFALLSTASLFATKESAQARSGDHLGVIWSQKEDQNVWRMPQQINKMGNNVQFTRSATTHGNAEGGFFLNKKDMKSTFGFDLPVNFGLYFNNSNQDFQRVSDNNTIPGDMDDSNDDTHGGNPIGTGTTPTRIDFFLGGFGDAYNLALRFGYNNVRNNASSSTAADEKSTSAVDFALGGTVEGFDLWTKWAMEPSSDNSTFKANSLAYAWQFGVRKEWDGFKVYAEYNDGLQNHLDGLATAARTNHNKDNATNQSFQLGVARVHKVNDNGEFFWDVRLTHTDISERVANHNDSTYNASGTTDHVEGWTFHWMAGLSHKLTSWLSVAGSLNHLLYNGLEKPFDASKNQAKGNLGFAVHFENFQLDLAASYTSSSQNDLWTHLGSTTGTLTYNF